LGLVAALAWCVPHAGEFLVAEDDFDHAPIALVLSGLPTSRAFAARDLYHAGRVDEILVIPEPPHVVEGEMVPPPVTEELVRLKLFDPARPQWVAQILTASGVPESKIVTLPEPVNGTINEARRVRTFLRSRLPARLVVITSRSASRHARFIFRRVFRTDPVAICSYPTPYDVFESTRWWSQPRNALTVVTEYQKLLVNALTLTFGIERDGQGTRELLHRPPGRGIGQRQAGDVSTSAWTRWTG